MTKYKLFTIVLCTYNGERYLDRSITALLSLNKLDELVDSIIIVDNNSNDGSKNIILKYAENNSIIHYEFEQRQGLSYARSHAHNANGQWVIYVDDDNILDSNWLIELKLTINSDESLGLINGAVIARPDEELTKKEKIILKTMYRNLACTHIDEPKLSDKNNTIPMGAGMCIRTSCIKQIYNKGWLKLEGRKGKKLSSGEDTELAKKVFELGYGYNSNFRMKLYHLIPKSRLEEKYIERLIDGLVKGRIDYVCMQNNGKLKLLLRKVKHFIILIKCKVVLAFMNNENEKYWKERINYIQAKSFLKN